jgi:23S rRNA G2445 N2-methylase RlmL
MIIEYLKTPLHKYTFSVKPIRSWVENNSNGKILNLFAGKTKLNLNEFRVDSDKTMIADSYMDAYDFVKQCKDKFDTIILDPPYAYRKSMEMYNGHKASRFNQIKDLLKKLLNRNGKVITFGYHSVSMGKKRGFYQDKLLIMSHGGAIHDTLAIIEILKDSNDK